MEEEEEDEGWDGHIITITCRVLQRPHRTRRTSNYFNVSSWQ